MGIRQSADVVVCGAGIAGVAAAWHLAVRQGVRRVVIVDAREPLTFTSNKGTQGYRNWWPGPDDTMLRFVSRSLELLEESASESANVFRMNRRGYLFATADETQLEKLKSTAQQVSTFGMGTIRTHNSAREYQRAPAEGFVAQPDGADLLLGDAVHDAFPYLAPDAIGALHIRRAGFLNGVALGTLLLSQAMAAGAVFVCDGMTGVDTNGGAVRGVQLESGNRIDTERLVIAAGPELHTVASMLDIELPVFHELHAKVTMRDMRGAVPRNAPFVIWADSMQLQSGRAMPGGVHVRPVDLTHGDELYLIWTYETDVREYSWPPSFDANYMQTVVEGCARMIPSMQAYVENTDGVTDGGFYCKTPENRPLIGPLSVPGAFVVGALSGSGLMSAHAAGELVAQHVSGQALPDYARWFLPSRYEDAGYREKISEWGPLNGQL